MSLLFFSLWNHRNMRVHIRKDCMTIRESFPPENCIELTGLHKIISSQRIPAKGVSIFLRGSEHSIFHVISNQMYGGNIRSLGEVIHFIPSFIFPLLPEHLFVPTSVSIEIAMNNVDEQCRVPALSAWHIVGTQSIFTKWENALHEVLQWFRESYWKERTFDLGFEGWIGDWQAGKRWKEIQIKGMICT